MATATEPKDPWTMERTESNGDGDRPEYELCPAGNRDATIVGLFDIGHQPATNMKGEAYDRHELVMVFELVKKRKDGAPFVFANSYTWSLNEKANFAKLVSNVTGKAPAAGERFDPRKLLGMPCTLAIVHREGKKDDPKNPGEKLKYANIGGVSGWSAEDDDGNARPKPKATIQTTAWSVATGDPLPEDIAWVPYIYGNSVKDLVELSTEHKTRKALGGIDPDDGDVEPPF